MVPSEAVASAAHAIGAGLSWSGACVVVIGITGNALPEDLAYFKDHGANVIITKPLANAKLMDAIHICNTNTNRSRF